MAVGYEKGVSFGGVHSYRDLRLVLTKSELTPPTPKTYYVDIPGRNGSIDMTEALGGVAFEDRTLKYTFTMKLEKASDWESVYNNVVSSLHGKNMDIVPDGSEGFYTGRITVGGCTGSKMIRQVVVSVRVSPYMMSQNERSVLVQLYETERTISFENAGKPVVPTIETTNDNAKIVFNGTTIIIQKAGKHIIPDIRLAEGVNTMTVSGSGSLTIKWREGVL